MRNIWEERWVMAGNIECVRIGSHHSEVALASFVEIADDLPVNAAGTISIIGEVTRSRVPSDELRPLNMETQSLNEKKSRRLWTGGGG
jgi:hypothetical protein